MTVIETAASYWHQILNHHAAVCVTSLYSDEWMTHPARDLPSSVTTTHSVTTHYSLQPATSFIFTIRPCSWSSSCKSWATKCLSWDEPYFNWAEQQRRHSKMAVSRHLGYYRTGNSAIQSANPENPWVESNMEWIGCTVFEIFTFKLYCDLESGVRCHSRSSKAAPLYQPTPKTWP